MNGHMKCPVCGGMSSPDFMKHGYRIYACGDCGHRFADVPQSRQHTDQVYGDGYFFEGGAGYQDYTSEADLLIAHGEQYGKLLRKYTEPGTVFDVGSAAGFILKGLTGMGWNGKGIEPNDSMASYARETLHMDVETGVFEQHQPGREFDLVTMIQVIAHVYDVRKSLGITRQLLRRDGLLLVETWDRESFPARLLGSNWHHYSPPSVVNWFTVEGLRNLVEQFGFEEVARGRPAKWITGAHAKSLVGYKLKGIKGGRHLNKIFKIVPDRLKIPYPSFDLFWALFRKK